MQQTHPIPPLYNSNSRVLILGSFPSVKSREQVFFYGHGQNRFWKVISALFGEKPPQTIEQKKALILDHHLALWDVIAQCDIEGSADASIQNVIPNDLNIIFSASKIRCLFLNGKTAEKFYRHYWQQKTGITAVCLPSTSPANAAWSQEKLIRAWSVILRYL